MTAAWEFDREHDGSLSLEGAVFQALGAASTCWESLAGTGVFDDRRAKEVGEALLAEISRLQQAGLEQIRDRTYRLGVQAVVDRIRGRLDQTEGVPSRQALYAQLAAIEQADGVVRG